MRAIFIDIESNGLNFYRHRTLEIGLEVVDLTVGAIIATYESRVCQPEHIAEMSDKAALHINGYTKEMFEQGQSEERVGKDIEDLFSKLDIHRKNAIYICQNPSFDRAFFGHLISPDTQEKLQWPYHWLDLASMFWTKMEIDKNQHPWEIGISKDKIAGYFNLPPEEKPHTALNGAKHLRACYEKLFNLNFKSLKKTTL